MIKKSILVFLTMISPLVFFGCKDNFDGEFYSLEEAYEYGWLTKEQLESISYHYYEECITHDYAQCEPFSPTPKTPLVLDDETEDAIRHEYLKGLKNLSLGQEASLDNVIIKNYLGSYNKCVIVGVIDDCACYDYVFEPERIIGGVLFKQFCEKYARVWKKN